MQQKMRKYLLAFASCCVLLFSVTGVSLAQPGSDTLHTQRKPAERNITAAEWQELTNDDAFSYRDEIENEKVEAKETNSNSGLAKALARLLAAITSTAGQVIIWGLLILVILYAVYKIVIGERSNLFGKRSKKIEVPADDSHIEDIGETDWEALLQKAAGENDLRLSVRYSYLLLLQTLQNAAYIQYRSDKTNYQYYSELADTPYKQSFRQLLRQYEYTWYGNFPISQAAYDTYISDLQTLKKQIGR